MDFNEMEDDELRGLLISMGVSEESANDREWMIGMLHSMCDTGDKDAVMTQNLESEDIVDDTEHNDINITLPSSTPGEVPQMSDQLDAFCSITGCDVTSAKHYLEACGWDVETALEMYVPDTSTSYNHPRQDTFNPQTHGFESVPGNRRTARSSAPDDEYENMHGIRAPDPVKQQRLVESYSTGSSFESHALNRADHPSVDWMFPAPRHLSHQGSFDETKTTAKGMKKWVLANIQCHTEFSSHMLNRDTWANEMVQSLVRSSFVFWQRGHTSMDGRLFMQLYGLQSESQLPHIAIIDSRTGMSVVKLTGYTPPEALCTSLVEFLDSNQFDNDSARKCRTIDVSRSVDLETFTRASGSASDLGTSSTRQEGEDGDEVDAEAIEFMALSGSLGPPLPSPPQQHQNQHGRSSGVGSGPQAAVPGVMPPPIARAPSPSSSSSQSVPRPVPVAIGRVLEATTTKSDEPTFDAASAYGEVPLEPSGEEAGVRVSIRLASGKALARKYAVGATCRCLFAVAAEREQAGTRRFDLCTTYPIRSLSECLDQSIQDAGLAGSQVVMRWL